MKHSIDSRRSKTVSAILIVAILVFTASSLVGDTGPSEPPISIVPPSAPMSDTTTTVDTSQGSNADPVSGSISVWWLMASLLLSTM